MGRSDSIVRRDHVRGLDMLRFLSALSVMLAHLGAPPLPTSLPHGLASQLFRGFWNNAFPGAPAVIVFFVVSGFCIHYPSEKCPGAFKWLSFYVRRFVRIYPPLLAAAWLVRWLGLHEGETLGVIVWSVKCELLYYAAYPAFRILQRTMSWVAMTFLAAVIAVGVLAKFSTNEFMNLQLWQAALAGLPAWLLGVVLAARPQLPVPQRLRLWAWRLAVYLAACLVCVLRFHAGVGFPWGTLPFSLLVFLWIRVELAWWSQHEPPSWLEWAGRWSYSLYLMHFAAAALLNQWREMNKLLWTDWALRMAVALALGYVFYLAVEKPSQLLARWAGRRVASIGF
jgi:peptidoglycan/LPS O-acetylase OafA/YrhL